MATVSKLQVRHITNSYDSATDTVTQSCELLDVPANAVGAVGLTGNETIAGTKTFSSTISGSVSGNAGTATKLKTARTINVSDNATTPHTGTAVSFNGSANVTIKLPSTIEADIVGNLTGKLATARSINISDATATNTGTAISFDGSANGTIKLPATIKAELSGNASTATALKTARTIDITDADGTNTGTSISFNGTGNKTLKLPGTIKANITGTVTGSLSGNASTASTLQNARSIDGVNFNGSGNIIHYAECTTAANVETKTVTINGFSLVTGAVVYIKFTYANTATTPKLQVNSTTAQIIQYDGSAYKGLRAGGRIYQFVYTGTYWNLLGAIGPDEYLPLAGGAMTGVLKTPGINLTDTGVNGSRIYHLDTSTTLRLSVGNAQYLGAALYLSGNNETNQYEHPGGFRLIANNPDTESTDRFRALNGYFDGDTSKLMWGGANVLTTSAGNAVSATKLNNARSINVSDSDGSHTGTAISFNGTNNGTIKLPSTIKATLVGNADTATSATTATNYNTSSGTIKTALDGKLSLSGGTMTATINTNTPKIIARSSDAGYIELDGATAFSNGAYLWLTGKDCTASGKENGLFRIAASDGTNTSLLIGHADGTLTWSGSNILTTAAGNAVSATKLNTARSINVSDADASHTGTAISFNGTSAGTIKLPATIKATLVGNADTATTATDYNTSSGTIKTALAGKVSTSTKVNGYALSGDVTVTKSDVGLGNCDNTSDANKPVSTATQTALNTKLSLSGGTMTGGFKEATIAMSNNAINLSSGNCFTKTISANTTFTITNASSCNCFTLVLTNAGAYTITWPSTVKWASGTPPSLTESGVDVITFMTPNGGTNWFGTPSILDAQVQA